MSHTDNGATALMVLACPNCLSMVTDGRTLTHSGLCPQPEILPYLMPMLPGVQPQPLVGT